MGFPPKISSPLTEIPGMGAEDKRNISILFSDFHLSADAPLVWRKGRKGAEERKYYSVRLFCFSDALFNNRAGKPHENQPSHKEFHPIPRTLPLTCAEGHSLPMEKISMESCN